MISCILSILFGSIISIFALCLAQAAGSSDNATDEEKKKYTDKRK